MHSLSVFSSSASSVSVLPPCPSYLQGKSWVFGLLICPLHFNQAPSPKKNERFMTLFSAVVLVCALLLWRRMGL